VNGGHDGEKQLKLVDRSRKEALEAEAQHFEDDLLKSRKEYHENYFFKNGIV
jgi:hypothetical protein